MFEESQEAGMAVVGIAPCFIGLLFVLVLKILLPSSLRTEAQAGEFGSPVRDVKHLGISQGTLFWWM